MKLLTSVEQVFRKLEAVDLGLVLTNLNRVLTTVEGEVRALNVGAIGVQATNLLVELRDSNRALQGIRRTRSGRPVPGTAVESNT